MHKPGYCAFVLGLDGDDKAIRAHGDYRLLQRLGV